MNQYRVQHTSDPNRIAPPRAAHKLCLALGLSVLSAASTFAALNAYEPYNYTLGATPTAATGTPTQTTGGGFTGPYNGGAGVKTTVTGLSYPGLLTANNALNTTGGYIGENVASPISTGPVYVSYLINMPTSPAAALSGLEMNTGGNGMFVGIITNSGTTSGVFGINQQVGYGNGGPNLWSGTTLNYGTTNFIVVELTGSGSGWTGRIWVNPTAGTNAIPTETGSFTVPQFTIAACTVVNPGGGNMVFDELRIATSWDDAVSYAPPTPLNAAITSPSNGATVGNFFNIAATASVFPGSVTNVAFYDGGTLLGNDTTSPYSYSANLTAGAHNLTVRAQSSTGGSVTSSVVAITVTNVPPLVVYEPFNYALGAFANNTPATGTGLSGNWTVANSPNIVAGQSYPNLPTANNAYQHAATGSRTFVNFASPVSAGSKYASFLFKGSGNTGGDTVGVFFPGSNANSLFAGFRQPFSAAETGFGLGTVSSAGLSGAAALGSAVNISNTTVHLIVLKIDFDTSGANDTVSMWIDPPAGTNAPGVAANVVANTFDVGVISGFGFNILGGYNPIVDELRLGDTYANVVGGSVSVPTVPTTVAIAVNAGKQVSWTAYATNNYQPQESPDGFSWTDLGSLIVGTTTTSLYDTTPSDYYQIVEKTPGSSLDQVYNGGFETADGFGGADGWLQAGGGGAISTVTQTSVNPNTGTYALELEGAGDGGGGSAAIALQNNVPAYPGPVTFSFYHKAPLQSGGANPQYTVTFFDALNAPLGTIAGSVLGETATNVYTLKTVNGTAPAGTDHAQILFNLAVGAGTNDHWRLNLDDVGLITTTPGPEYNVVPTVVAGAGFTGTVQSNSITATDATGTIKFLTNSVQLSINALDTGAANSANAIIAPPYTVTAIYSGDGTYLASTNTLVVGGSGPSGPALLTNSVSGGVLSLTWPSGQGWRLQMQTNSLATGLGTNWIYLTDGSLSGTNITVDATKPTVFYRLTYP